MSRVKPDEVREILDRHMLLDGYPFVVDLDGSFGSWLRDALTGKRYLDFYTFFASSPLGFNHPRLRTPEFRKKLVRGATHKPANSDVMTVEMAEFVEAFSRIAMPDELPHLFVVEGGALAVENAMKAAFDWKVRKNLARGVSGGGGRPGEGRPLPEVRLASWLESEARLPAHPGADPGGRGGRAADRRGDRGRVRRASGRHRRDPDRADPVRGRRQPLPRGVLPGPAPDR